MSVSLSIHIGTATSSFAIATQTAEVASRYPTDSWAITASFACGCLLAAFVLDRIFRFMEA